MAKRKPPDKLLVLVFCPEQFFQRWPTAKHVIREGNVTMLVAKHQRYSQYLDGVTKVKVFAPIDGVRPFLGRMVGILKGRSVELEIFRVPLHVNYPIINPRGILEDIASRMKANIELKPAPSLNGPRATRVAA